MTRRECLALGGMALAIACGRKNGVRYAGYVLIATSGEYSITVVDLAEFRLFKQVAVGAAPKAILAGNGGSSLVLTPETGSVHLLDKHFNRVVSRKLADQLSGFQLTEAGKRLMAIAGPGKELIELDASTLRVGRRWKLAAEPVSLDVSSDGDVGISTGQHGSVELVDGKTGAHTRRELGGAVGEVKFRPDGKLLLVANCKDQSLTAFDVPSLQVVVDLPLAMQPQNLCFKPDGGQLFVSGAGMDGVAIVFPYLPLEVEQTVLAGRDPGAMACSDDPAYLFVASASGSDVCILNVPTRRVVGIVEVGQRPCYVTVTPDSQYALVLNEQSGDMAVIRISSIVTNMGNAAKKRSKVGASLFTMLPVGSRPVQAVVVARQA